MLLPRAKLATRISAWEEQLVMEALITQPGEGNISHAPAATAGGVGGSLAWILRTTSSLEEAAAAKCCKGNAGS